MKKRIYFLFTLIVILGFIPLITFAEFWAQNSPANLSTNTGNGLGNATIHVAGCVGCGAGSGVTNISTTDPITGGPITATGTIGITKSGTSTNGYLSSTDWNIFNNKKNNTATSTEILFGSSSSTITSDPNFTWNGTLQAFRAISLISTIGGLGINDSIGSINYTHGGHSFLNIDSSTHDYKFGDIDSSYNGTFINVEDNAGVIALLGNNGSTNGMNMNFPDKYFSFGDSLSPDATYLQTHNYSGESSIIMNGNLANAGIQNQGFFINFINSTFGLGDTNSVFNQTALKIDDSHSTLDVTGFNKTISYNPLTTNITGLTDLTWDDTYLGTANRTYQVWIDGVGTGTGGVDTFAWQDSAGGTGSLIDITASTPQTLSDGQTITWGAGTGHQLGSTPTTSIIKYTSETTSFVPGDIIDNGAGVTATVINDDTLGNLTIELISGGHFAIGQTIIGGSSGAVTTINSVLSYFQEDITFQTGRMLALDGQGLITSIGDIDGFALGAKLVVNNITNEVNSTADQTTVNGMTLAFTNKSGAGGYTIKAKDYTIVSNTTQSIKLPTAIGIKGRVYVIKNTASTPSIIVSVKPFGSETIDGLSSYSVLYGKSIMVQSDGSTGWDIIAGF